MFAAPLALVVEVLRCPEMFTFDAPEAVALNLFPDSFPSTLLAPDASITAVFAVPEMVSLEAPESSATNESRVRVPKVSLLRVVEYRLIYSFVQFLVHVCIVEQLKSFWLNPE